MAVSNPTGTPSNFQKLIIRIKDNGIARSISWGSVFASRGATLPTITTVNKWMTLGFIYNSNGTGTWDLVALSQEA
jgi:hypothetical protein